MTLAEVLGLAQALSPQERKELAILLIDSLETVGQVSQGKTGAEIAALLRDMEPVEFVDPDLQDPVAWVKAQRGKRLAQLQPYRDDTE